MINTDKRIFAPATGEEHSQKTFLTSGSLGKIFLKTAFTMSEGG
jgi:hypothetical protein